MFFKRKKTFLPQSPLLGPGQKTTLSFCITHKNRLEHIKQTLPKNLEDNRENQDHLEFVLVDFDDQNLISQWIWSNFPEEIKSGYLKYYYSDRLSKWSSPVAKNTAHYLAKGTILSNLDCDNFTGKNGGQMIINAFENHPNNIFYWQFSGVKRDGSYGRMSITRDVFETLGGYNEQFLEMGYQDNDLKQRAKKYGLELVQFKDNSYNKAIKHDKYEPNSMSFKKMNAQNERMSKDNIKNNLLIANAGKYGIRENIYQLNHQGRLTSRPE